MRLTRDQKLASFRASATLGAVLSRISLLATFALVLVFGTQNAEAGLFGGFTGESSYQRGDDQLCQSVTTELGLAKCSARTLAQFAKLSIGKGERQRGSSKKVSAKKIASKICVLDAATGAVLFRWDSGQIISAIGDIYLHGNGRLVAVEFTSRIGGRQVDDLIVVQLTSSVGGQPSAPAATTNTKVDPTSTTPTTTPPKSTLPTDPPEFTKAMKTASKWAKRKKHSKARTAYKLALTVIPEHPEALYLLARSEMASKDKSAAVATLARIPQSKHARATHWRVEARFDLVFKSLRGQDDFRLAVGITRAPGDSPTLYEKLVAFGGSWEQERIPCEQPQVNLRLRRDQKRRFDLIIRSKCQGTTETTRLDGAWAESGDRKVGLSFPNSDAADEDLSCQLELCSDDSGENCLRCELEKDIEFLLRVVRR